MIINGNLNLYTMHLLLSVIILQHSMFKIYSKCSLEPRTHFLQEFQWSTLEFIEYVETFILSNMTLNRYIEHSKEMQALHMSWHKIKFMFMNHIITVTVNCSNLDVHYF